MAARRWFAGSLFALVVLAAASCAKPNGHTQDADVPRDGTSGESSELTFERPKPLFLRFYTPPQIEIEAKIPQYTLPLTPDEIANWAEASVHFKNEGTAALILANGFAVEEGWGEQLGLIEEAYEHLPKGVPIFVTVDTALHVQHVLLDQLYSQIEQTYMLADLQAITDAGLRWSNAVYTALQRTPGVSPKQIAAARLNVAYFAVAAALLDPEAAIPPPVLKVVTDALLCVKGGHVHYSGIFRYRIDYGRFQPRGHYTRTEALQRYFRAMTWYAECVFLFQEGIVSAGTADIQTIQALQIGRFLVENDDAHNRWRRMHAVLEFFAGAMDDASVADVIRIKDALDEELGAAGTGGEKTGESTYLNLLRERLHKIPPPAIHAATGMPMREDAATPERRKQWLEESRGMRLFGQRFSLDGYAMSELTGFAYMGEGRPMTRADTPMGPVRGYPSPLDVIALLGSRRAEEILRAAGDADYARYDRELARLKTEVGQLTDDDWHGNLAMCRLNLIRMRLQPVPEGYPSAMRTGAWSDHVIHASLATWVMLKHDTLLNQKQPSGPYFGLGEAVRDYAEPAARVYTELIATNQALIAGLGHLYPELKKMQGQPVHPFWENDAAQDEWTRRIEADHTPTLVPIADFTKWLEQLLAISLTELRNEALDEKAGVFLGSTFFELHTILGPIDPALRKPSLVADVFTEPNEGRVLEVATGRFNLLWIVYQLPSGEKVIGAGPVMSYYEFKQPMDARLSDEDWRDMLTDPASLKLRRMNPPSWTKSFLTRRPRTPPRQ